MTDITDITDGYGFEVWKDTGQGKYDKYRKECVSILHLSDISNKKNQK